MSGTVVVVHDPELSCWDVVFLADTEADGSARFESYATLEEATARLAEIEADSAPVRSNRP